MNDHPHFCDCDVCLNGTRGLVLPGCGIVHAEPAAPILRPPRKRRWGDVVVPGFASQTRAGIELERQHRRPRTAA